MTPHRSPLRPVIALLGLALLSGCSLRGPGTNAPPLPVGSKATLTPDPQRMQIVFTAMQQVGVPYRWGGANPGTGFDCSGLVQYSFGQAGLPVPRTAEQQHRAASPLRLEHAAPGDLLFFRDRGRTSHVAIYVGDGRFVHAPRGGKTVSLADFDNDYWRQRFAGAGRIAADD